MGLLATAAVADMPVGAPPPFASALEPGSRTHADKRGTAWLTVTITVEESRSRLPASAKNKGGASKQVSSPSVSSALAHYA